MPSALAAPVRRVRRGGGCGDEFHQAELSRAQLGQISDLMASPATGSDAVLWATGRTLEAADQLLQAYPAGRSPPRRRLPSARRRTGTPVRGLPAGPD
ncbi:MAG TPA: hypothetical protein VF557_06725 [Jatrophihabitans sp.]|uniref:hypothetical protein n=1 Tax=Jatrophihabitans sp. TaxID=1932789 RepID=UPI002EECE5CD